MFTPGTPPVPHVGGPIVPPGVPTVLIGGMAAAVVGDTCTCVGPPDSIIFGSTGVMIGGKPAARTGDFTAHGGVLGPGCPTVLIGEVGVVTLSPSVAKAPPPEAKPEDNPSKASEASDKESKVNPVATLIGAAVPSGKSSSAPLSPMSPKQAQEIEAQEIAQMTPCQKLEALDEKPATDDAAARAWQLEQSLGQDVKAKLETAEPEDRVDLAQSWSQYAETSHAADGAWLSNAVYEDGHVPPGFRALTGAELKEKTGLDEDILTDPSSGFASAVYESTTGKPPPYRLAMRGTEFTSWNDWSTNIKNGLQFTTPQHMRASLIGNSLRLNMGANNFSIVGHSLGGGLATVASSVSGAACQTYNGAGISDDMLKVYNLLVGGAEEGKEVANRNHQITAYSNSRDVLTNAQTKYRGAILGTISGLASMWLSKYDPKLGQATAAWLGRAGNLTKAQGRSVVLETKGESKLGHGIPELANLLDEKKAKKAGELKREFGCDV